LSDLRVPFDEAIGEPRLLKKRFDSLSVPQQTLLKVAYGLELTTDAERQVWSATQESVEYDNLGYVTRTTPVPYTPSRYQEIWAIIGRRGSKTDGFAATIVAYEAALGGHEAYIRKGQRALCFQVAQDLRMARYSLHFIRAALESSPLLSKMITDVTADRVDLRNGLTIATVPPTVKSVRGYAAPVIVMDEVGSWYQESDSANPDYEIYRAALPGQLQFPDRLVVGISTPWNKAGLLYKMYAAGTMGRKVPDPLPREEYRNLLVLHGTTAMMQNPLVSRDFLLAEFERDPEAFARECLAQFQDSISGFIPTVAVERALSVGLLERSWVKDVTYVGAIDAGFRHDSFTFTIVHRDSRGHLVQDCVREWKPRPGHPLNPEHILQEIRNICDNYALKLVYGDQYQLESLQSLARHHALAIIGIDLTRRSKAKILGSMQQLFMQSRIHLLDHFETAKQVKTLERKLSEGGNVLVAAPPGMRDDLAMVLALACHQAGSDLPRAHGTAPGIKEPTAYELCMAQIERQRQYGQQTWD
jgi:hypothetical protein